jgi:predicted double-glycine peptidase
MKRFLAAAHMSADGYKVTLDQVAHARLPGIALIDVFGYKHFVVLKGIEGATVLLGDPAVGLRRMSAREFTRHWNGVLFVINGRDAMSHASFSRRSELALAPSGRNTLSMEPISQAALALTRPGPEAI